MMPILCSVRVAKEWDCYIRTIYNCESVNATKYSNLKPGSAGEENGEEKYRDHRITENEIVSCAACAHCFKYNEAKQSIVTITTDRVPMFASSTMTQS